MEMSEEKERLLKILTKTCAALSEHFSTVQIFVTKDPVEYNNDTVAAGDTLSLRYGVGNWFSRYGQVVDFIADVDIQRKENMHRKLRSEL